MEQQLKGSLTARWLIQSALGVLLVILLGAHLIVNHWAAPNGLLSYADIIRYYDIPGIAWMEIMFLIVVTAHALMGVHAILLDLAPSSTVQRVLTQALIVIGMLVVGYGVLLILAVKKL